MKSLEAKKTPQPVRCSTASGDLRWMVAQSPHDSQAEDSGQGRRRWKPVFIIAALPLALLFAYGFVRFMLELVFPIAVTRH
ncbi:hypothetical protein PQR34_45155 [Paraburkholderia sediminicola]|uniref:hypothetical protein n=1 Tax=Paraburkholderia sediminicola TaxID=458836 RepID=UPI0038B9C6CB